MLYDAIYRTTGSVNKIPGLPPGTRAAQLLDSEVPIPSGFLDLFGKPPRESACECERSASMMLGPVLNLVNGPVLAEAIKDPDNRIARLVVQQKDDSQLIKEIYFALLCREPSAAELEAGRKALQNGVEEYPKLVEDYQKRVTALADYEKHLAEKQVQWEKEVQTQSVWTTLEVKEVKSARGATLTKQPDGSVLATGPNAGPEVYTVKADTPLKEVTAVRLEVLPDPSLPAQGPGRASNGNFVLNEFKVTAVPQGDTGKPKPVPLKNAQADFSQDGWAVTGAIDNNPETGWAVMPQFGKRHVAAFEAKKPIASANGVSLTFTLDQRYPGKDHNIGRFRLSVTSARSPVPLDGLPEPVVKILAVGAEQRTPEQKAELAKYFRGNDPELARLRRELADYPRPLDPRLIGAQDLAWALMNSPAFLFNH